MKLKFDYQSIKNAKQTGRHTTNEKGLQLLIKKGGYKYWVLRYTYGANRHDLALGSFPEISVADARKKAQEARYKLSQGINPIADRKAKKEALITQTSSATNFEKFALEVIESKRIEWSNEKHASQWEYSLREYAFPVIGRKRLDAIDMEDILKILTPIWKEKTETASRLRGRLEWILAAATTRKLRTGMNPALWRGLLQTILPAPRKFQKVKHHKALAYRALPAFMTKLREIDSVAALALEFLILNANRTSEVTDALRIEIVGDTWTIPAERMKARVEHRVPLCKRSLEIIEIAKTLDKDSDYIFSRKGKKLSNMAMPMAVRRMGEDVTVHGFRSTFRDWVSEETMHSPEVAEMALAHTIGNKVEAAYRRGDLFERRRILLAEWEIFCHSKTYENVLSLKAA
ncbi:integrase arm-type DNA-binding domain-containing protein [Polynucleobacter paneuropaeus]|jgi:integrase|nr:integrase arm-type DNA-binding domain-containing protein [Polynucleobacter paneuropaeus]